jgi:hypothetical protein
MTTVPKSRQRKAERQAAPDCTAKLDAAGAWEYDELRHEAQFFRSMIRRARDEGESWNDLCKRTGVPTYALMVLCGETVGRRPSVDRQSGR